MIEDKIDLIFSELKQTLSKGEILYKEYDSEVNRLAMKYLGIEIKDEIQTEGTPAAELELMLSSRKEDEGIYSYTGLKQYYVGLKGVPLKEETVKDIQMYTELKARVFEKVYARFQDHPVLFGKYMNYVHKVVDEELPDSERAFSIGVSFTFGMMNEFNFVTEDALTKTFLN